MAHRDRNFYLLSLRAQNIDGINVDLLLTQLLCQLGQFARFVNNSNSLCLREV